jgi:hypothetical protein
MKFLDTLKRLADGGPLVWNPSPGPHDDVFLLKKPDGKYFYMPCGPLSTVPAWHTWRLPWTLTRQGMREAVKRFWRLIRP